MKRQTDFSIIRISHAKQEVIDKVENLAPRDLQELTKATTLNTKEPNLSLINQLLKSDYFSLNDTIRLFYYVSKILPSEAELLRALLYLEQVQKDSQ